MDRSADRRRWAVRRRNADLLAERSLHHQVPCHARHLAADPEAILIKEDALWVNLSLTKGLRQAVFGMGASCEGQPGVPLRPACWSATRRSRTTNLITRWLCREQVMK